MRPKHRLVAALVLAGLILLFVLQNTAVVDIRILFWTVSMSRSLMFFILVVAGIAIGWFLRGHFHGRRRAP